MKLSMCKVGSGIALVVAAWGISAPALAAGGTVSYTCQNNKSVRVRYQFNSAGLPTTAQAVLNGANRVMRYDMNNSDNVDTFMKDGRGYRLSSGYLDVNNYQTNSININAPDGTMLFKSCTPSGHGGMQAAPEARRHDSRDNTVAYACQNNRRMNVRYRFNSAGIPTHATVNVRGRNYTLNYDQGESDNMSTLFTGRGYRLGAGYIDSGNYRSEGGLILTAPNNQILYKDCRPVR